MQRKTEAWKKLTGTLKRSRHKAIENPESELAFARELHEAMRLNLSLAAECIRLNGMQMTFLSKDKNGNVFSVQKMNPALRILKEATRTMATLKAQIAVLEEQTASNARKKTEHGEWMRFARPVDEE